MISHNIENKIVHSMYNLGVHIITLCCGVNNISVIILNF